jgi:hypothetical protein
VERTAVWPVSDYFKNQAWIARKMLETSAHFWMRHGIDRENALVRVVPRVLTRVK